jgi:cobalt-zinc-cadmium efflux system outer membrane protein
MPSFQQKYITLFVTIVIFVSHAVASTDSSSESDSLFEVSLVPKFETSIYNRPINRQDAIEYTLERHPILKAKKAKNRALQAEFDQLGLLPNPTFELEIDDFAGRGSSSGFSGSEITSEVSIELETFGKRSKRKNIGFLKYKLAMVEFEASQLEVANTVDRAFTTLLEFKSMRGISEQNLLRAEKSLEFQKILLNSGKNSRLDVSRSELALSEAREELIEIRGQERKAILNLSKAMGVSSDGMIVTGSLTTSDDPLMKIGEIEIYKHPLMLKTKILIKIAEAKKTLEEAKRVSNIEVGVGLRHSREMNENSAVAGLSIPLLLFNRNQGNIRASSEYIKEAEEKAIVVANLLKKQLDEIKSELLTAQEKLTEYDSSTVVTAQQTIADVNEAYAVGKASLFEVLDAKRVLYRIEKGRLRAHADFIRAKHALKNFYSLPRRKL